ncbi:MAG: hypothetical protein P4L33_16550 [Capsulimonadaceae bacterium]|nr:hypothetical protein [Capsulimonadaceae bacterium]
MNFLLIRMIVFHLAGVGHIVLSIDTVARVANDALYIVSIPQITRKSFMDE